MSSERERPSRPVDTPTPRDLSPDPSPPESRASPSFSFHEERRLLKSDEYWLSTRLVGGRPSSVSTSPQAGKDALANFHHSLELDQAIEEAYTDVLQARGATGFVEPSTMESPSGPEGGDLDPLLASVHRQEGDRDERLSLAEEKRERQISNMNDIVHPMAALRADEKKEEGKTQTVDTGESPAPLMPPARVGLSAARVHQSDGDVVDVAPHRIAGHRVCIPRTHHCSQGVCRVGNRE